MKQPDTSALAIGLGCDRGTALHTLQSCLKRALAQAGLHAWQIKAVASINLKADETGLLALMEQLACASFFFTPQELAAVLVPNPSDTVRKFTGTPSVSEAAALLAAARYLGLSQALDTRALLVEKFKHRGEDGRNATVSIALCDPMYSTLQE
jgi:cobalt-precorrin 5A hydrolase